MQYMKFQNGGIYNFEKCKTSAEDNFHPIRCGKGLFCVIFTNLTLVIMGESWSRITFRLRLRLHQNLQLRNTAFITANTNLI
jgi:hypothetical protein